MLLFHIYMICIVGVAEIYWSIHLDAFIFTWMVLQDADVEEYDLLDPSSSDTVVGKISLSCFVEVCSL